MHIQFLWTKHPLLFHRKFRGVAFVLFALLFFPSIMRSQTVTSPVSSSTNTSNLPLIPIPREIKTGVVLPLDHGISISAYDSIPQDTFAVEDLLNTLKEREVTAREDSKGEIKIVLMRETTKEAAEILSRRHIEFSPVMHNEGYVVVTEGKTTYDIAATGAGIYYGAQTIKQLIIGRGADASLHGVVIRDWPAMKYRGLSDDLSRGPIPTLAFQKHQVRVLSEYKVNIYSPYFEVSLAYKDNPLPAPPGGAMTRADVEELVRYARQYHVTIVPDQEAFGHLHHALMFETYSPLAETPHGSALAPGQPGSIQLIQQWFAEIAAMFPSPFIHIGADEVNELGSGQSKESVAREGAAKVYIEFLIKIHNMLEPLHKTLLFWGDIAMNDPGLVKTLPKDMIAVAWEYGPHPEGFDKWLQPYVDAGIETWVSPGINDWSRVYPNNYEGLLNIQGFVSDGQRVGSTGVLNTVWNTDEDDEGLFNNDWYGVIFGAAAGWQAGTSSIPQFENSYGQVFHGDMTGKINQAQLELTAAQLAFRKASFVHGAMTDIFWTDPWSEQGQIVSAKLLPMAHEIRQHAERAIVLAEEAKASGPLREPNAIDAMELAARRIDFMAYKFQAAQEIVNAYDLAYKTQNGKRNAGSPLFHVDYFYIDLINGYGLLHDMYQQAWLQENRPYSLHDVMVRYDLHTEMWMRRSTQFNDAKAHFLQTHLLPKPEEIGLPPLTTSPSTEHNSSPSS